MYKLFFLLAVCYNLNRKIVGSYIIKFNSIECQTMMAVNICSKGKFHSFKTLFLKQMWCDVHSGRHYEIKRDQKKHMFFPRYSQQETNIKDQKL